MQLEEEGNFLWVEPEKMGGGGFFNLLSLDIVTTPWKSCTGTVTVKLDGNWLIDTQGELWSCSRTAKSK